MRLWVRPPYVITYFFHRKVRCGVLRSFSLISNNSGQIEVCQVCIKLFALFQIFRTLRARNTSKFGWLQFGQRYKEIFFPRRECSLYCANSNFRDMIPFPSPACDFFSESREFLLKKSFIQSDFPFRSQNLLHIRSILNGFMQIFLFNKKRYDS